MVECIDCGKSFHPKRGFETRCFPCWKAWKQELGEWRGHAITCPHCERLRDNVRLLLQLAHPDRHGGSDAAQKATRLLLELRDGGGS